MLLQMNLKLVSVFPFNFECVLMKDVGRSARPYRCFYKVYLAKATIVICGRFISFCCVRVKVFEFHIQYCGLEGVKPAVHTDNIVLIFYFLAMVSDHFDLLT